MKSQFMKALLGGAVMALMAVGESYAQDRIINDSQGGRTGTHNGHFWTWFEGGTDRRDFDGDVRIGLYNGRTRHFRIQFNQERTYSEDAVGGMGWRYGSRSRIMGYNIGVLNSNASGEPKAIAAVYGWGCSAKHDGGRNRNPNARAQEYYIVESWGGSQAFVPWDENAGRPARPLKDSRGRTVKVRDGGATYKVYKTPRNGAQYCGDGRSRGFTQYWSVREGKAPLRKNGRINFRKHSDIWDNHGFQWRWVNKGYQIFAGEAFGHANFRHKGTIDASVWLTQ